MSASDQNREPVDSTSAQPAAENVFTGDVAGLVSEMLREAYRAGAKNVQFVADRQGLFYQDDGRILHDITDINAIVKLKDSGVTPEPKAGRRPFGLGTHLLLSLQDVQAISIISGTFALKIDCGLWRQDEGYIRNWLDNVEPAGIDAPGMRMSVTCSKALSEQIAEAIVCRLHLDRTPARDYFGKLNISVNGTVIETTVPSKALPAVPLINTSYQGNHLIIGLPEEGRSYTSPAIWVDYHGRLISADRVSSYRTYLEVRHDTSINLTPPHGSETLEDESLHDLWNVIEDELLAYFGETPIDKINVSALERYFQHYPSRAWKLPYFVAARRKAYKPGDDIRKVRDLYPPEVFSYERPPLLLADNVRIFREKWERCPYAYDCGLHSFVKLIGEAYKVIDAKASRLDIQYLWWKPGEQISLPKGCRRIFYESGHWGVGKKEEPPLKWHKIGTHVVFAFDFDCSSDDKVTDLNFVVGSADPMKFYRTAAWAGCDLTRGEKSPENYRWSCEREIRKIPGNAVPESFTWDDLLRFVPKGQQIIDIKPEYQCQRNRRPTSIMLILLNGDQINLRLF